MKGNKSGAITIILDLTSQMGKSLLMTLPPVRRWRLRSPRTSYPSDIDKYLRESAFLGLDLVLECAGGGVRGRSVCEIGPGDYLTSSLSFLAAGASRYTAVDRFPGNYFGKTARELYSQVKLHWNKFYPEISWNESIDAAVFPDKHEHLIELVGEPIEKVQLSEKFDILCSFQVGEHVTDIEGFANAHNRLLEKDGIGLHRVDFGPHDVWSDYQDPTTFLRLPDLVWQMTGSNRGIPNRRRHHEFLEAFDKANLVAEVLLTENFEQEFVDCSKLNRQFRTMPKDSVMVKTAIYRVKRK